MTILQTWTWLQTLSWSLEELAGRAGTPGRLHSPAKRGRFNNYKLTKNRMMMRPMMTMTIMVPSWNDSLWMSSAECLHTWNHQCHEDLLDWKWFWGQKWRKGDLRSHLILPVLCPHQSGCHHPPVRWDCHHVMRGRKTTTCTPSSPSCPGTSSGGRWWCLGSTEIEPSPAQTEWRETWAEFLDHKPTMRVIRSVSSVLHHRLPDKDLRLAKCDVFKEFAIFKQHPAHQNDDNDDDDGGNNDVNDDTYLVPSSASPPWKFGQVNWEIILYLESPFDYVDSHGYDHGHVGDGRTDHDWW